MSFPDEPPRNQFYGVGWGVGDGVVNGRGLDWVNGMEVEWVTGFPHIINGTQN